MKEIFSRRSIRKYKDQPVEEEQIQKMLRAAMYAPSAGNEKPWHFVIVKDRNKLNDITSFHPHTQMLKEAPLGIMVCADVSDVKYDGAFWVQDIAASVQNILLQGEELGLGTCWCGVYPREELVESFSKLAELPEHIIPVAVIAVGHPAEEREVRERYNPDRVHYETW
ncbi:nitroreductase [Alkaliphilus metalliredigens QYMF]|uniref:Nitroreductase n=1 Tax=Alkaliphilus metalliredigens (strain QYMF) TaxID=293826 RepID=A6TLB7_ALKMQ|nr:nitroreductase family protein [Alkaliphilus metalliredigens]ABR46985.1 nitroreductase [Alkaliphilus metalliredigens QYMF]